MSHVIVMASYVSLGCDSLSVLMILTLLGSTSYHIVGWPCPGLCLVFLSIRWGYGCGRKTGSEALFLSCYTRGSHCCHYLGLLMLTELPRWGSIINFFTVKPPSPPNPPSLSLFLYCTPWKEISGSSHSFPRAEHLLKVFGDLTLTYLPADSFFIPLGISVFSVYYLIFCRKSLTLFFGRWNSDVPFHQL
jgi:hypothetical protein